MNWVGGIRERIKKSKNAEFRQKEYFKNKEIMKLKKQNSKYRKPGVSQDILNLKCVSTAIRNPFDMGDADDHLNVSSLKKRKNTFSSPRMEEVPVADSYNRDYSRRHPKKRYLTSSAKMFPSYQSTPIAAAGRSVVDSNYSRWEKRNVHHFSPCYQSTDLFPPSPITSVNSSCHSPIHVQTCQTDEELLLQETTHPIGKALYDEEMPCNNRWNTFSADAGKNTFSDISHLHGVAYTSTNSQRADTCSSEASCSLSACNVNQYDMLEDAFVNMKSPVTPEQVLSPYLLLNTHVEVECTLPRSIVRESLLIQEEKKLTSYCCSVADQDYVYLDDALVRTNYSSPHNENHTELSPNEPTFTENVPFVTSPSSSLVIEEGNFNSNVPPVTTSSNQIVKKINSEAECDSKVRRVSNASTSPIKWPSVCVGTQTSVFEDVILNENSAESNSEQR